MTTQNIYSMTDVWDDVGTTFKGISLSVTDTASASGSLLMDLQVGGSSKFSVSKDGTLIWPASFFLKASSVTWTFASSDSSFRAPGDARIEGVVRVSSGQNIGFSSGAASNTVIDAGLFRDAADTLAQRRSTNPQAFRVYNTYTDVSNYERGFLRWNSNVLEIGAEAAGAGLSRATKIGPASFGSSRLHISTSRCLSFATDQNAIGANGVTSIYSAANAVLCIGAGANSLGDAGALELKEMTAPAAPAANGVRIYAEDDGTGKTRLMALFATGAAQQIAIEP